jgi:peroxiredoxin
MSPPLSIGDEAPSFDLPATDGLSVSLEEDAAATVVVFTCNHCPYALAWHGRLLDVARDYEDRGVRSVHINPNDAERYPADSFDAMRRRVEDDGGWPVPYVHDVTQAVAGEYGARTTPDVFVLDSDRRLAYRGAPDSDHGDPAQGAQWLREALDDVLAGRPPVRPETEPVGCSVKWRA